VSYENSVLSRHASGGLAEDPASREDLVPRGTKISVKPFSHVIFASTRISLRTRGRPSLEAISDPERGERDSSGAATDEHRRTEGKTAGPGKGKAGQAGGRGPGS